MKIRLYKVTEKMGNDGENSFHCRLEECDDSNLLDGDGCSKKCRMETGFNCKGESTSVSVVKIAISL